MEDTEKQQVVDYRGQLVDRMKTRFPNRDFTSVDGQDSPNSLEESVIEALAEGDAQIGELTARVEASRLAQKTLSDLFYNSPRAAMFLNELAATGNAATAIYRAYGKDAHKAFIEGDASDMIAAIEEEDAKSRAESDAFEEEKRQNLQRSFDELDAWGNEKGLTNDEKVNVFMRFYNILSDAILGKYSRELFEMGWKADNYDTDVESARKEGEVAGRNAKIDDMTRRRRETQAMPPSLSGQGQRQPEAGPKKEEYNPWQL